MSMKSFAQQYELQPGDVLIGPKSQFEIVQHYVVYLGKSGPNEVYMDNNIKDGVRYLTEEKMAREQYKFAKIRRLIGDNQIRNNAVNRAVSLHRKPYHLTKFNCEHFANLVQYNYLSSTQANNGVGILATVALGLFFAFASTKNN